MNLFFKFTLTAILLLISSARSSAQTSAPSAASAAETPQADTSMVDLQLTDNINEMVASAPGVVLVDFYADWCGPCQRQGRILHDMQPLATSQHASIIKVNIDRHEQLARRFNVSSLPTLLLVKNGMIIERATGVADRKKLTHYLQR